MSDSIESFVTAQNIGHFKTLLETETHPDKRGILLQLLANELAKFPEPVKRAEMRKAVGARGSRWFLSVW